MNTPVKKQFALFALLALGFIGTANAQRGERSHDGGSRNAGGEGRRSGTITQAPSVNRQSNGSFDHQSRHEAFDRHTGSVTTDRQNQGLGNRTFDNRNTVSRSSTEPRANNSFDRPQAQRNTTVFNNNRVVNNYRYSPRYNYNYGPRRYVYAGAPRYSILPHGALTIRFGGYPYYYHSGLFYGYYSGYYEPVFAPIGIHINILPLGYYPFYVGPQRYYYYDGVYYRNYNNNENEYEVIDAPVGAQVSALPKGATAATINGEKFYEFNGTYYKETANSKNEVVYTVAGKYGHVNNTDEANASGLPLALHVGDVVPVLPDSCKELTINGEQLYLSPDNTYFKAQTVNGTTSYKIVGMGAAKQ